MARTPNPNIASAVEVHLFMLLRQMIEFEITNSLGVEPSKKEILDFVMTHYPSDDTVELTKIANYFAGTILKDKPPKIDTRDLNWMVKLVTKLGQFASWQEFYDTYSSDFSKHFSPKLSQDYDYTQVRHGVNMQLHVIYHSKCQELGNLGLWKSKEPILYEQLEYRSLKDNYNILKICRLDVDVFRDMYEAISNLPYNSLDVFNSWYDKNPYVFWSCITKNYTVGVMTVLPLKWEVVRDLKYGLRSKLSITASDLYSPHEKSDVKYIFIETLLAREITAIREFRDMFAAIPALLSSAEPEQIIVCCICCHPNMLVLLQRFDFTATSYSVRIDDSGILDGFMFFEKPLADLLKHIMKEIRIIVPED